MLNYNYDDLQPVTDETEGNKTWTLHGYYFTDSKLKTKFWWPIFSLYFTFIWTETINQCDFVFRPAQPVTINAGMKMPSWFVCLPW